MTSAIAYDRPSFIPGPGADLDALVEAIKTAWQAGERPDTREALAAHPDLAADRDAAVDLAYTEFCLREEQGEVLDPEAFCAGFPHQDALAEVLSLHTLFQEHPGILERVTRAWPSPGERFGDFELVGELGRGACARVYLGRELTAGGRLVALKVTDEEGRDAELLGPLSHPHLIPVLSSPRVPPWTVLVMPFLGAATLRTVLEAAWTEGRDAPLTARIVLDASAAAMPAGVAQSPAPEFPVRPEMSYEDAIRTIAAGVFSSLAYLHARGIAHRDLKPSNVLLAPTGHPYLLDLNLAVEGHAQAAAAGTPAYMSPEQLRLMADPAGPRPADWRPADVFAAGVMLFELLTGRHPYAADLAGSTRRDLPKAAANLLARQGRGRVQAVAELNPRVGRPVVAAIERCLDPDPARRPTAKELADLLAPRPARRGRRRFAAAMAALAVACAMAPAAILLRTPDRQHVAVPAAPAVPATSMERGLVLFRQGESGYKLAALEFMNAGKERQDGRAYALAAYCFALAKDHFRAVFVGNEAERLGFAPAALYANRAYSRMKLGKYMEAKADCDKALELQPNLFPARYTRAYVWLQLTLQRPRSQGAKAPPEAIDDIRMVMSGSLRTADICLTAALLYTLADKQQTSLKEEAVAAVRQAILAGMPAATIGDNRFLSIALGSLPEYQKALQLKRAPGKAGQNERFQLVNPDPEVLVTTAQP